MNWIWHMLLNPLSYWPQCSSTTLTVTSNVILAAHFLKHVWKVFENFGSFSMRGSSELRAVSLV